MTWLIRDHGTPGSNIMPGGIVRFAGNFAPEGFLEAKGQTLLISEHQALFEAIGTLYGGDGQSTFKLPDLRGRIVVGADADHDVGEVFGSADISLTGANLPNTMGGSANPADNDQPAIAMTYIIALQGVYPSRPGSGGGGAGDGTQPYLGEVQIWAGSPSNIPRGWAIAGGQTLQIAQNTALFSLLGTNFGGDGRTTFRLPDLQGRAPMGFDATHLLGSVGGSDTFSVHTSDIPDLVIVGDGTGKSYFGGDGNDQFTGNGGNDTIAGGLGTDTAVFTGPWSQYTITNLQGTYIITDKVAGRDGADTVAAVELFKFGAFTGAASALVNVAPISVDDTNTGDPVVAYSDATATGNVLANDTDGNSTLGDTKTVTGVRTGTEAAGGALGALASIKGTYGTLTLNADGSYTYAIDDSDPDTIALANGATATDVFTYGVADSAGLNDTAQLTITVTGGDPALLNVAPVAIDDSNGSDAVIALADATATGNVLDNDIDSNSGDSKTVTGVRTGAEAAGGALGALAALKGVYGTLTLNADGSYTYVLDNADPDTIALAPGATGTDVFTYAVADSFGLSDTAQLTVMVAGGNDAPVIGGTIGGSSASVEVAENNTTVTTISATDPDGGALAYSIAGGADGALFKVNASTGAVTFAGAPDYEAPADADGNNVYEVIVRASDGVKFTDQTLAVTVTNVAGNTITGTAAGEKVNADQLVGGLGSTGEEDMIDLKGGNDTIVAGLGNDTLRGGAGHDGFKFITELGAGNVDTIVDFKHNVDTLKLSADIFTAIGGSLSANEFYAAKGAHKAHDGDDAIIYNTKNGKLFYDADGKGGDAAVHFATLENRPQLDHGDFDIV
jgi:VCBS repeat-containing protein